MDFFFYCFVTKYVENTTYFPGTKTALQKFRNNKSKWACAPPPCEVVSSIFYPVPLNNIFHVLSFGGKDREPCQHSPEPILLSNMISTWKVRDVMKFVMHNFFYFLLNRTISNPNLHKQSNTCSKTLLPAQRQHACIHQVSKELPPSWSLIQINFCCLGYSAGNNSVFLATNMKYNFTDRAAVNKMSSEYWAQVLPV